jgi:hypothetical protein
VRLQSLDVLSIGISEKSLPSADVLSVSGVVS